MRWHDFEAAADPIAAPIRERFLGPGVVLVGTIRRDGSPRISPVEPFFWDGDLWLSMMWQSRKAQDIARDPRVLVHSVVSTAKEPNGEAKVRGRAVAVEDPERRRGYAEVVAKELGWSPDPQRCHYLVLDVEEAVWIRYENHGDQRVLRWPNGIEYVRGATSDTSVGEALVVRTF